MDTAIIVALIGAPALIITPILAYKGGIDKGKLDLKGQFDLKKLEQDHQLAIKKLEYENAERDKNRELHIQGIDKKINDLQQVQTHINTHHIK